MKKTFISLIITALTVGSAFSQKTVYGTVDYSYKLKGENSEAMAGMMPEKMVIKYGESGVVVEMVGGMMAAMVGKTVVNNETGEAFMIKDAEKTVYMMDNEQINEEADKVEDNKLTKTDETKEVYGYNCTKYVQTTIVGGTTVSQDLWVTDKLKTPEYDDKAFAGLSQQTSFYYDIDGFPLQIEIALPGTAMQMVMEVTNIDFGKIDKSEFKKPEGYTVKPMTDMNAF